MRPFLIFPVLLKTIQVRLCNCLIQEYSFSFYDLIRILNKSSHFGSDRKERITKVASQITTGITTLILKESQPKLRKSQLNNF